MISSPASISRKAATLCGTATVPGAGASPYIWYLSIRTDGSSGMSMTELV